VGESTASGDPPYWGQATPPDGYDYTAINGGLYHSIALQTDGGIICWGDDTYHQSSPPGGNDFVDLGAGDYHNLAIRTNSSLASWGYDIWGQVSNTPAGTDYIAVAAGRLHSLALRADGSLASWGIIYTGDPNLKTLNGDYDQVTDTPAESNFIAIAAGKYHSVAIAADEGATTGSIKTWGYDRADIDLGSGYYVNYNLQIPPEGNDFVAVAAGVVHSLALRADGTLLAWGANSNYWSKTIRELYGDFGQVTNTPTDDDYIAIAAGDYHNVALKSDGSIVAWGRDNRGQVTDTPTGTNFIAVAAGGFHSMAILGSQLQGDFNADWRVNLYSAVYSRRLVDRLPTEPIGSRLHAGIIITA
jgi:alpha-tubulin suppressor-like RCC1 family protein